MLIEEWNISATQASFIVSGFFLTYAFSLLGFSWLSDQIGAKRSVSISALATALTCTAVQVSAVAKAEIDTDLFAPI